MTIGLKANVDGTSGAVQVNGNDVVTVNSSGQVGIGTSSPVDKLQIKSGDIVVDVAQGILANLYYSGSWKYAGNGYGGFVKPAEADGAMTFFSAPNNTGGAGAAATVIERMRVTSDGNVAIGQTAAYASTIGNVRLSVAGGTVYNASIGPAGYGLYNGGATAEWFMGQRSSSDHSYKICTVVGTTVLERLIISTGGIITAPGVYYTAVTPSRVVYTDTAGNLGYNASILAAKTNVADLIDTDWLAALRPVTFNYRKLDEDRNYTDEAEADLEYGLIAEEVEGVNTELVFYDETENGLELRGVHYNKLIVPLLAEVQKLRAELTDTKARLAALEAA